MKVSKDTRIGIIGAGPAGLAAAEALREKGYTNITILEKSDRPGGMSYSFKYPALDKSDIMYEMGSLQPPSSHVLFKLFKRYDIHVGKKNLGQHADPDKAVYTKVYSLDKREAIIDFTKRTLGFPYAVMGKQLLDFIKLFTLLMQCRELRQPGYRLSKEKIAALSIPFDQWVDQQNFKVIGDLLKMFGSTATFSNPQIKNELSTLEVLKLVHGILRSPIRYINGSFKFVREGYQTLWIRSAATHNVIYNITIKQIKRDTDTIQVHTDKGDYTFNKLIMTPSPTEILKMLDVTAEEKTLFEKVNYAPGWRVAFTARNLPHDAVYSLFEPYKLGTYPPMVQSFYPEGEVGDGVWLYSGMLNHPENTSIEPYLKNTEQVFKEHFQCEELDWINSIYWPEYSPYFQPEDIKNGIHAKLAALQGQHNTYFLGGIFGSHTHALISEYSYAVVGEHF